MRLVEAIVHMPGHKNSAGNDAEWVIKDHETGKILSSHSTEDAAKEHLGQMESHAMEEALIDEINALLEDEGGSISANMSGGFETFVPEHALGIYSPGAGPLIKKGPGGNLSTAKKTKVLGQEAGIIYSLSSEP